MSGISDNELVARHLEGDTRAFGELVARYMKAVYNFVYLYARNEGDAEDITQDAFMNAWKGLRAFDRSRAFKPWLFSIAKNASLNWLKKKKPVLFGDIAREGGGADFEETIPDEAPLLEEVFEERDLVARVEEAMRELPPEQQAVIVLHHTEELSFREIAEMSEVSLDTVKSRYRRALIALRGKLRK